MRIRIFQSAVLAAALLTASAGAQEQTQQQERQGRRGRQMAANQVEVLKDRLKLNDDQVAKVKPILAESAKKAMELRRGSEPGQAPSEETQAAMAKNREETNKKLSEVLSKEQMTEYEKMLSERRGGFGRPGGKRGTRNQ